MATVAQIRANQLNAQKSTGPRSVEGKAAIRFNSLKHGVDAQSLIIPGEDPAELQALIEDYQQQLRPAGTRETFLVQTLVRVDWSQRRLRRVEAQLYRALAAEQEAAGAPPDTLLGAIFLQETPGSKALRRVMRHLETAERTWFTAMKELRRCQEERSSTPPEDDLPLDALLHSRPPVLEPSPQMGGFGFAPHQPAPLHPGCLTP
jgi:hypothetical protein